MPLECSFGCDEVTSWLAAFISVMLFFISFIGNNVLTCYREIPWYICHPLDRKFLICNCINWLSTFYLRMVLFVIFFCFVLLSHILCFPISLAQFRTPQLKQTEMFVSIRWLYTSQCTCFCLRNWHFSKSRLGSRCDVAH